MNLVARLCIFSMAVMSNKLRSPDRRTVSELGPNKWQVKDLLCLGTSIQTHTHTHTHIHTHTHTHTHTHAHTYTHTQPHAHMVVVLVYQW